MYDKKKRKITINGKGLEALIALGRTLNDDFAKQLAPTKLRH